MMRIIGCGKCRKVLPVLLAVFVMPVLCGFIPLLSIPSIYGKHLDNAFIGMVGVLSYQEVVHNF